MSNTYKSKSNVKFKKLRNKDSYMFAFLERRKKAADFALTDKKRVNYQYDKPFYILKNEEELMELKKKSKNQMNSIKNKSEFYKTYNTLKNSLTHKNSNSSSLNKVIIEKENNKYYLSPEFPEKQKVRNNYERNLDKIDYDVDTNKKYNNIKHHTINVSSNINKNINIGNNCRRNYSWKNLQIQKASSLNNLINLENNKKNENDIPPSQYLVVSNEYEFFINKHKNNPQNNINKRENDIDKIIEKYQNNEEKNNYNYNKSSSKKIEIKTNFKYNINKPNNLSEPKNIYGKAKNVCPLTESKSNNNIRNDDLNFNYRAEKINEISPIKTYYQYNNKEHNEDVNKLEKTYDNHTLNYDDNGKLDNIKMRNDLKLVKNNYKKNENQEQNLGCYNDDKSLNMYNINNQNDNETQKLKNVGILYKNKKYYIEKNLKNIEIPLIIESDPKKMELDKDIGIESNNINDIIKENNYFVFKPKEESKYPEENYIENDNQKINDFNKSSKEKENDLMTEKCINSIENKNQHINNTNNNFNLSRSKENNNKIKNIKTQSYKKLMKEHNYELIKDKNESFLKPKEEKEPNIQSKVINSLLSSKEDLINNNNNNNISNHNKSLVRNIQEKIKILKNNKTQNLAKEYNDYLNEIDECYNKIKLKEEKDNMTLKKYYNDLVKKEYEYEVEGNDKIKEIAVKIEKNKPKETIQKNENKKTNFIQKSKRLEYIMRNLLNNQKYNYFDYHYLSNKLNKTKTMNKENIDINNIQFYGNNAPDINLIADQSNEDNINIIDENEFSRLRKKNLRSARNITNNTIKITPNNNGRSYRRNSDNLKNYSKYVSPRLIIKDINHKIMPPNELI